MLFVLVACSVYLGMNWYVLTRLFRLFAQSRSGWFYLALALLTLSLISALILESRIGNCLTGVFYTLAVTWLGLCWLLLWILLAQQVLALVLPAPPRMWAIGVCGLAAGLALYAGINARTITIRREPIPHLPLKVAHLSDIHIGSIGASALDDIIAKTNALMSAFKKPRDICHDKVCELVHFNYAKIGFFGCKRVGSYLWMSC